MFDDVMPNNVIAHDAFALTQEEIYVYFKVGTKHGKEVIDIFNALQAFSPICVVGYSNTCGWVKNVNIGRQESKE